MIRSYPHDSTAFTQGLFFEPGGTLLESTGLYGESSIRRVELDSGRVIKRLGLESDDWFGEGIAVVLVAGAIGAIVVVAVYVVLMVSFLSGVYLSPFVVVVIIVVVRRRWR